MLPFSYIKNIVNKCMLSINQLYEYVVVFSYYID